MKKKIRITKQFGALGISPLLLFAGMAGLAQEKAQERIGVYDSRAIAVAFAGSPAHEKQLQQLRAEHQQAKAAGDLEKAAQFEAQGKAWQQKAHQQGFSTAPVDDILTNISNSLPEIRKAAGVTVLLSKWDTAELKKHPGAQTVDVTMQLVDAIKPNERQRKYAIEIQKQKPIPLEAAANLTD